MTPPHAIAEERRAAANGARLLRWGVAFVWLWTGLAVLHPYYREQGAAYLAPLGLPPAVMYATCAAELVLGVVVAFGWAGTWVTALQVVLITGFTAILSVSRPQLWLDPLGMLTKNLPLLAMIGTAWLLERERWWSDQAFRLLQGGLILFWVVDGLAGWLFAREAHFFGATWLYGVAELVLALLLLRPPGYAALLSLLGHLAYLLAMMVFLSLRQPLLWFHPFGPLTKYVALLVGTLVLTVGGWTVLAARRYDERGPSTTGR